MADLRLDNAQPPPDGLDEHNINEHTESDLVCVYNINFPPRGQVAGWVCSA